MSEQSAATPPATPPSPPPASDAPDLTRERSRAFVALALGLVGAMGGGVVATSVAWLAVILFEDAFEGDFLAQVLFQGFVPGAFGVAALWLAAGVRSSDPVAVPAARAAQVLAAVALAGAVLTVVTALVERS
jgi:hypothetical protein